MKEKAVIIVLLIVAIGLSVGLIVVNNKARQENNDAQHHISDLSNKVVSTQSSLTELKTVNHTLETNLAGTQIEYSNKLTLAEANLHSIEVNLEKAKADARERADADAAELAKRDKKIADLETQNLDLDKQAADLRAEISGLETRISDTQKKLASSEGDRTLLLSELKQLQTQKADLERKFNDLASLREQTRLLKTELATARKLDWIRRGVYATMGEKGGERLMNHGAAPVAAANGSVEVEVRQSGAVKIQEPAPTNGTGN